jgi:hypothetical protein
MFDKAAFLQAIKPKTTTVEIEGFGTVNIKQLSVAEVEAQRAKLKDDKSEDGKELFGLRLLAASLVDENGVAVLSDDDLAAIRDAGNAPVEKLVSKVLELNGFARAEAKN